MNNKDRIAQIIKEEYEKLLQEGLITESYEDTPRRSIKESIGTMNPALYGGKINAARRSNMLPPRQSNWYAFAREMDIGVLDLDTIAYDMGFKDFNQLDAAVSPRSLDARELDILAEIMYEMNGSDPYAVKAAAKLPYGG